jgi:arabinose-5-phosphate isomerase
MALLEARGFTPEDFARLHPGGQIGKRLLRVEQLMHSGEEVPRVLTSTPMRDAIYEMSRKRFGITAVTDDGGRLVGCISDGDLRRMLERGDAVLQHDAGECMRPGPRTIAGSEMGSAALKLLEDHRITSLFVTAADGRLEGIVHLHDLWGLELF